MKTTLKTLSEAWKHYIKNQEYWDDEHSFNFDMFVQFVEQPLKLEMFIPCKDEVPLEEPKDFKVFLKWKKDRDVFSKAYLKEFDEYQKAKDRVLFKGFERLNSENRYIVIQSKTLKLRFYGHKVFLVEYFRGENLIEQISDLEGKVQLTDKQYELLNL